MKMPHRRYPLLFRILIWLVLPGIVALWASYAYLARSLPQEEGTLKVAGLHATVRVVRDAHDVPHIFAVSDRDAFFAIGYLHAQERLWQMEYRKRLGQGRLSEVLGTEKLILDQYMRTLGLHRAAKLALRSLDEAARESLLAYVDGVNSWIEEGHVLPLEYHILGFKPERWQPEDSILQIKLMALDLDFNYRQELMFDLLVKRVGVENALDLMPSYASSTGVASAHAVVADGIGEGLMARAELASRFDLGGERLGSNAWVVSGKLTRSGSPMLANDPHLAAEIPAAWYLAEIHAKRLHVAGATYPGVPFVILGRNESIAWGGTALGADVQDLYMERVNPANEDQYEVNGQWVDMEVDEEWITVKSEFPTILTEPIPPLRWKVRRTRHGPLISDVIERIPHPMAMRWTALNEDDRTYQSFLGINYAHDWETFKSALSDYVTPTTNFVYADKQGNIAYIAGGKIPIRNGGDGKVPVAGWLSSYDWGAYIPIDELPQSLNPRSGYIVSANNANHAADYQYLISNSWAPPYRAERITQAIQDQVQASRPLEVKDFVRLQGDRRSLQAQQLLTFLRKLQPATPQQQHALNQLKSWDGTMLKDSEAAALYQSWFRHFNRLVVNDELVGDLLRPERFDALQNFAEQLNPEFIHRVVSDEATSAGHRWCDLINTTHREDCEAMALAALDRAVDEGISLTGEYRQWGEVHTTYYEHRGFTEVQLLDYIFDRELANGGDAYSINVGGWKYSKDKGYRQSSEPSYRQVIDLSDWRTSRFINSTGQSGNVLSPHYDDNIQRHDRLEMPPMQLLPEAGGTTLLLEPAAAGNAEAERE